MNNDTKDKIPSNGNFSAKQDNQGSKLNKPSNTLNKGFNPSQFKDNAQKQVIKEGAKTAAWGQLRYRGDWIDERQTERRRNQEGIHYHDRE